MHTRKKTGLLPLVLACLLVMYMASVPALAAPNGVYLASAHPHYRHPSTGVIEDSGGESSEVLGQSMAESATHPKALVEVDPKGNTYVTVRLLLQDSISGVSFSADGAAVSAACVQEGSDWADYRMPVNSENSVIRCKMFVAPMGRDVVFFLTLSGLQPGSGDFETGVEVRPAEPAPESPAPVRPGPAEPPAAPSGTPAEKESTSAPEAEPRPSESDADTGLLEFDASGNPVTDGGTAENRRAAGLPETLLYALLGAAVLGGAGFCIWYFGFFKKK